MEDPNTLLAHYRETSRHLWNQMCSTYDGEITDSDVHALFGEINRDLMITMLLWPLCIEIDPKRIGAEPIERMRLRTKYFSPSFSALVQRPSTDGNNYWDEPINELSDKSTELYFIDYFDWQKDKSRDFEFIRSRIKRCDNHVEIEGRDCLLRATEVRIDVIN